MDTSSRALQLLRVITNDPEANFRPGQKEAIEALLQGKRQVLVQATGWGKSAVYFIAAKMLRERGTGPAILVSPLLSLMRNQIASAIAAGIHAVTINSSNIEEWESIQEKINENQVDILLISPERLANKNFIDKTLGKILHKISMLIIDEVHCISDWGHDFRPDYQRIKGIIRNLPPNIFLIGTTATANKRVVEDVKKQLGEDIHVVRGPLTRKTLYLWNKIIKNRFERMAWLARMLPMIPGFGIIYVLTKRNADLIAEWLNFKGINVSSYHSDSPDRKELEQKLINNELKALVATVALGMGFDKPDIGFVIHYNRPASVVHYYQQVGRAGRCIDKAYCILLEGAEDQEITDYFREKAYPSYEMINEVLELLEESDEGMRKSDILRKSNMRASNLNQVLKILELESPSPIARSRSLYMRTPNEYHYPHDRIEAIKEQRLIEQGKMREYMRTGECLTGFLSRELGDDLPPDRCGHCCNCATLPFPDISPSTKEVIEAERFVRSRPIIITPKKRLPSKDILPSHPDITYNLESAELTTEQGRILCYYSDGILGDLIRDGKYRHGKFSDDLVEESAKMITDLWFSSEALPFSWITCVPSTIHPKLVPDFARRLGRRLDITFIEALKSNNKKKCPQKDLYNVYMKVSNLDGEYTAVKKKFQKGDLLLVDDMIATGWTLAVVAAVLKSSGFTGKIYPFAIAKTSEY